VEYNIIKGLLYLKVFSMDYLSAKEVAEKWNISRRRVQILCEEGRIEGAFKLSDVWVIPKDATKPADRRKTKKEANE
jgi:DNA-binding transcriptional regulator LsrR (DeoR family)